MVEFYSAFVHLLRLFSRASLWKIVYTTDEAFTLSQNSAGNKFRFACRFYSNTISPSVYVVTTTIVSFARGVSL